MNDISPSFLRFRASHHYIARMFASGCTISKVSDDTGMSRRRLNILLSDPSFQDLIAEKAKTLEDKLTDASDWMDTINISSMKMACGILHDRLEESMESDEPLPIKHVLEITKTLMDRFGYGPRSTRVNVNADFAVRLDRAIDRTEKVIEARPTNTPPADPPMLVGPRQIEHGGTSSEDSASAPARSSRGFPRAVPSFNVYRRAL